MGFRPDILTELARLEIKPPAKIGDCGSQDFGAGEIALVNKTLEDEYSAKPFELNKITPAGDVFKRVGFEYSCFDIDGRDETIYLDFHRFKFSRDFYDYFDVTLNGGTSEHLIAPHGLLFFYASGNKSRRANVAYGTCLWLGESRT